MTGIYFLLDGNEVVYVGQTKDFVNRIKSHSNKKYTSYRFIECEAKHLLEYEGRWIRKFKPKFNKIIPMGLVSLKLLRLPMATYNKLKKPLNRDPLVS